MLLRPSFVRPTVAARAACLNKATEEQALNRIYRIGQTRETHVHKLVLRARACGRCCLSRQPLCVPGHSEHDRRAHATGFAMSRRDRRGVSFADRVSLASCSAPSDSTAASTASTAAPPPAAVRRSSISAVLAAMRRFVCLFVCVSRSSAIDRTRAQIDVDARSVSIVEIARLFDVTMK